MLNENIKIAAIKANILDENEQINKDVTLEQLKEFTEMVIPKQCILYHTFLKDEIRGVYFNKNYCYPIF